MLVKHAKRQHNEIIDWIKAAVGSLSIPQIDWQSKNIIEETKDAYLEWGFAQYESTRK